MRHVQDAHRHLLSEASRGPTGFALRFSFRALAVAGLASVLLLTSPAIAAPAGAEGLPADVVAALEAEHGVPTAPLLDKAREGAAKGVPASRIALVISDLAKGMRAVDAELGALAQGPDRDQLLPAAAAARRAGASVSAVVRVARSGGAHRSAALRALADLMAQGFAEDASVRLVEEAALSGNPSSALGTVASAAAMLVAEGVPLGSALDMVQSSTQAGGGGTGGGNGWGAGGSKDKDTPGKGTETAPGQEGK